METSTRGQSAAAIDDVGDGRRFPDPTPPHGTDTDSASVDMAALVFRREQLLLELHRERIRHDMIMCELAETERVMTACLAGRGAVCGRPLMTTWEEAMYRTSRTSEETSWWRGSPSGPVVAPVYPRVESSPSPVLQPRPVDNAQKQECGRPLAVVPSVPPDVEQCPSLSKQAAVKEALMPAATNAVVKPAQPPLLCKEVILESQSAVGHKHEAGSKDRHVVQLMQSEIQRREQLKRADVHQNQAEAGPKDTHAVQLMDCEIQRSEQPKHATLSQECRAGAKDSHAMQQVEFQIKRSEQLKCAAAGHEHEVDTNVRHEVQAMETKFQRSEQVKHGAVDQEHEADVNSHEVQQMESEIHIRGQPKCEALGQEHEAEEKDRHAVQLSKVTEQPMPAEPTIKDHTDDEQRQAGKEKSPPNEQKRLVFNKASIQITPSGVKGNQILGPIVETPPPKRHKPREEWSCTFCQVSLSSEEDLTRHQAGELHRLILAAWQSRQEAAGLTAKSTPESSYFAHRFNRKLVRPALPNKLQKSEPQKANWVSGFNMSHQENTQALHIKERRKHFTDKSPQESTQALHTEGCGKEGSKRASDRMGTEDPRKKFVADKRLSFCELCKVQCNSEKMMQDHLRGKKHRENLQARQ